MFAPNPPISPPIDAGTELPAHLLAKLRLHVPGYELLDELGTGGQATVYRARELTSGLTVAIKILPGGQHADAAARERFRRETAALKAINHPNIVCVIEAGTTHAGLDFLVMNYVEGKPLDALWKDRKFAAAIAPEPSARLRLFKRICEVMQAAHRRGITHRDLSPSNILLDSAGEPHILDFGLAVTAFDKLQNHDRHVTMTGQFIGKLQYASPEQARGDRDAIDLRTDVYALGVLLYQLLTDGAFPYEVVGNLVDVLNNIIHSKPTRPSERMRMGFTDSRAATSTKLRDDASDDGKSIDEPVPLASSRTSTAQRAKGPSLINSTIEVIVLKALEKRADDRYESAGALGNDIENYLAGRPTSARLPQPQSPSRPKFNRALLTTGALIAILLFSGALMNARLLASWLGIAALFTSTVVALPPDIDPGVKLDAARDVYERSVEDIRVQVVKAFEEKDTAFREKGDFESVDKLKEQRENFERTGAISPSMKLEAQLKEYGKQRAALINAYSVAATAYSGPKVKLDGLRKLMLVEQAALKDEEDLNPWSANLLDGVDEAQRTLDEKNPTWTLKETPTEAYRIEISGKAAAGAEVTIEVPTLDGKGVSLPAKADSVGGFRIILTIRKDEPSIDMGVDRQLSLAASENEGGLLVRSNKGQITIDIVRLKKSVGVLTVVAPQPVGAGAAAERKDNGKPVKLSELFPINSRWVGSLIWNGKTYENQSAKVVRVTDEEITIEYKAALSSTMLRCTLKVDGENVTPVSIDNLTNPRNTNVVRRGSGSFKKNKLDFTMVTERVINGKPAEDGVSHYSLTRLK